MSRFMRLFSFRKDSPPQPSNTNGDEAVYNKYTSYHTRTQLPLDTTLCRVLFLDGSFKDFAVPRKAYGSHLLQKVFTHMDLLEIDYFGLLFTDDQNVQKWLEDSKRIKKQYFTLDSNKKCEEAMKFEFRVKFYSSQPSNLKEEITRYHIFTQVKQDITIGKLQCPEELNVELAALVLQAELGDYEDGTHTAEMVSEFKFCPNQTIKMEQMILEKFKNNKGMSPGLAELTYLNKVKWLETYGADFHKVLGKDNNEYSLGLVPTGILIFEHHTRIGLFYWPKITRLELKKQKLILDVVESDNNGVEQEHTFVFRCYSNNQCKQLWKRCVQHHTFFRLSGPTKPLQVKHSFLRVGSRFKHSGNTELQSLTSIRARKSVSFKRSPSQRFERRKTQENFSKSQSQQILQSKPQQNQYGSLKKNDSLKRKQQKLQPQTPTSTLTKTKPIYTHADITNEVKLPLKTNQFSPTNSNYQKKVSPAKSETQTIKTIITNHPNNFTSTHTHQASTKPLNQHQTQQNNATSIQTFQKHSSSTYTQPIIKNSYQTNSLRKHFVNKTPQAMVSHQPNKVQGRNKTALSKTTSYTNITSSSSSVLHYASNNSTMSRKSHIINRPLSSYKKPASSITSNSTINNETYEMKSGTKKKYNQNENNVKKKKVKKYIDSEGNVINYGNKYNSTTVLSHENNLTPSKKPFDKVNGADVGANTFNSSYHASLPKRKKVGYQVINKEPLNFQQLRQKQKNDMNNITNGQLQPSKYTDFVQTQQLVSPKHGKQNVISHKPSKQSTISPKSLQLQLPTQPNPRPMSNQTRPNHVITNNRKPTSRQQSPLQSDLQTPPTNFEEMIITPPSSYQEQLFITKKSKKPRDQKQNQKDFETSKTINFKENLTNGERTKNILNGNTHKPNGILKNKIPKENVEVLAQKCLMNQPNQQNPYYPSDNFHRPQQTSKFKRVHSFIETQNKIEKPIQNFYSPPQQPTSRNEAYITREAANQMIDKYRRFNQVRSAHVLSTEV